MNILTFEFIIFALAVIVAYFLMPKKYQWTVLFFGNLFFYFFAGIPYITYMLIISIATFVGAICLEKTTIQGKEKMGIAVSADEKKHIKEKTIYNKKIITTITILISMGIWGY